MSGEEDIVTLIMKNKSKKVGQDTRNGCKNIIIIRDVVKCNSKTKDHITRMP